MVFVQSCIIHCVSEFLNDVIDQHTSLAYLYDVGKYNSTSTKL